MQRYCGYARLKYSIRNFDDSISFYCGVHYSGNRTSDWDSVRHESLFLLIGDKMSYAIIGERDNRWQPRKGLEGPFFYADGRVLYYDPKEGQYWDPLTDFYVEQEEMDQIHGYLARVLSR